MQCTISDGDLPMDVTWRLNDEAIPAILDVSTSKMGKRMNVLLIESVKAGHAGNYSCVARNQAGVAEYMAPLIVIGSCPNAIERSKQNKANA